MTPHLWFLVIYGGLVTTLVFATVVVWEDCQPAGDPELDRTELTDIELAALNGGPQLAAITAVTSLRRSHVMQTPEGTLVAVGPLADGTDELERELFETVRQTPGSPGKALVENATQSESVQRIVARLVDVGLRLDDGALRRLTALWICAGGLAVAGALSAFVLLLNDLHAWQKLAPGGALVVAMLLMTRWIGKRRKGPTAAGRRLLDRVRNARSEELRAVGGHLAFAVAMFGTAVLWSQDAAYADALGIPAYTSTSVDAADAFSMGFDAGGCGGCGCGGCG